MQFFRDRYGNNCCHKFRYHYLTNINHKGLKGHTGMSDNMNSAECLQGESGFQGLPGPRGPPGQGLQGDKVP